MSLEIDWREPPPSPEAQIKAELKQHPGRWARIKTSMASTTAAPAWRKDGFEVQTHPVEGAMPKKYDIYARWPRMTDRVAATHEAKDAAAEKESHPAASPATGQAPNRSKAKAPNPQLAGINEDEREPKIPTSGDVTGGYMASRARRAVPTDGATTIRPAGHNPSPVRP